MVYLFLADGFEEMEAICPIDLLRRVQVPLTVVGVEGRTITGSHNVPVVCDKTAGEISSFEDMEMVVLPGGPGITRLEQSPVVQKALDWAEENGLWIAAICAAPSILGHRGMLKGKEAVCYPGYENALEGAVLSDKKVCIDGRMITGRGAGVALDFAMALVQCLKGDSAAQELKEPLQCSR